MHHKVAKVLHNSKTMFIKDELLGFEIGPAGSVPT